MEARQRAGAPCNDSLAIGNPENLRMTLYFDGYSRLQRYDFSCILEDRPGRALTAGAAVQ